MPLPSRWWQHRKAKKEANEQANDMLDSFRYHHRRRYRHDRRANSNSRSPVPVPGASCDEKCDEKNCNNNKINNNNNSNNISHNKQNQSKKAIATTAAPAGAGHRRPNSSPLSYSCPSLIVRKTEELYSTPIDAQQESLIMNEIWAKQQQQQQQQQQQRHEKAQPQQQQQPQPQKPRLQQSHRATEQKPSTTRLFSRQSSPSSSTSSLLADQTTTTTWTTTRHSKADEDCKAEEPKHPTGHHHPLGRRCRRCRNHHRGVSFASDAHLVEIIPQEEITNDNGTYNQLSSSSSSPSLLSVLWYDVDELLAFRNEARNLCREWRMKMAQASSSPCFSLSTNNMELQDPPPLPNPPPRGERRWHRQRRLGEDENDSSVSNHGGGDNMPRGEQPQQQQLALPEHSGGDSNQNFYDDHHEHPYNYSNDIPHGCCFPLGFRGLEQRACLERQRRRYWTRKYVVASFQHLPPYKDKRRRLQLLPDDNNNDEKENDENDTERLGCARRAQACSQWAVQLAIEEGQRDYIRAYEEQDDNEEEEIVVVVEPK